MVGYWTTEQVLTNDPIIAGKMNDIKKVVFSKTIDKVNWLNTKPYEDNIVNVIKDLKQKTDKNILIFGSANLTVTLKQLDLIDEYSIMINPVILGQGHPLFIQTSNHFNLKLKNIKTFNSGNVLLQYEPV